MRKSGAWYTYEGDQLGQGKENARNFMRDNPDVANEIEKKIKEKLGVGPRLDAEAPADTANGNGSATQRQRRQREPGHCWRLPAQRQRRWQCSPSQQQRGRRQRSIVVPGRRYRPGCHGLAHDPYGPGFRVRGSRGVRGCGPRRPGP